MRTQLLKADESALSLAAELLKNGQVVGIPTETVYGLGADALNEQAVLAIFAAKERPADNPLIVHVADFEALDALCHVNDMARRLSDAFWPGPLTMILPKKAAVPTVVTANLDRNPTSFTHQWQHQVQIIAIFLFICVDKYQIKLFASVADCAQF